MKIFERKHRVIVNILLNEGKNVDKQSIIDLSSKIKGVTDSFITENSKVSDIVVFAKWKESEILTKLKDIAIIRGVRTIEHFVVEGATF